MYVGKELFSALPYESRFRGEEDWRNHPLEVWEHFENIVKSLPISQGEKVMKFEFCLKEDALDWFKAVIYQYKNVGALKNAFLDEFWGLSQLVKLIARFDTEILQARFGETRLQHFHKWYRWSKFIGSVGLSDGQIIKTLKGHFPAEASKLAGTPNTIESIEDVLKLADRNNPIERVNFNINKNDYRNINNRQ